MTTASPVEGVSRECACGLERSESKDYLVCRNCDMPQATELLAGGKRVRTKEDHMFDLVMARRMRVWYPNS